MAFDPLRARFPFAKGGYESYYLVAHDPSGPRAIWIRYTIQQETGGEPVGYRWLTVFDGEAPPLQRREAGVARADATTWLQVGDDAIAARRAHGTLGDARWELSFEPLDALLAYLPSERMYRGPLPRTKPLSLAPRARFAGRLVLGARTWSIDGWEGMVGHNWGSEHAQRWIWLHGLFDDGAWIDVVAARIALGPVTTPWIANGAVSFDGTRRRIGGIGRSRSTTIDATAQRATLLLPGQQVTVHARVTAPVVATWDYADPGGGAHTVTHGSTASLELEVRHDASMRLLRTEHACSYELGVETVDAAD